MYNTADYCLVWILIGDIHRVKRPGSGYYESWPPKEAEFMLSISCE
jgi:hypothetical protein